MSSLAEILLTDENRPVLIADSAALIEAEVASKRGVSGLAIKTGFKTIKLFKRGIVPDAVTHLIDDFVGKLEPFYAQHQAADGAIKAFVVSNADAIADALLGITDSRAATSKHKTLVKAYKKLRPQGKKQVIAAMPRIGDMLAKHGI